MFAALQTLTAEAQRLHAQAAGMDPTVEGNTLLAGQTLIGVYGPPSVQEAMLPGGGTRRRTVLELTLTREQLTAAPAHHAQVQRLDLAGHPTYRIEFVDTHDPFVYRLGLYALGE